MEPIPYNSHSEFEDIDEEDEVDNVREEDENPTSAEETAPGTATGKRKSTKLRSRAWNHFVKILGPDGESTGTAKCVHYGNVLSCNSRGNGTSGMLKHIDFSCPKIRRGPTVVDKLQKKIIYNGLKGKTIMLDTLDEKRIRRLIVGFIIEEEQPFLLVEKPGFIKMINGLEPRFEMVCRRTIQRDCMRIFVSEKSILKERILKLNPRICLTTDAWTSLQNVSYMCVTAHFIDTEWILHKKIIGFQKILSHNGIALSEALEKVLNDWGLDKVLTITVDNASSNKICIDALRKNMLDDMDVEDDDDADIAVDKESLDELRYKQVQEFERVRGGILMGYDNLHMRCSAHILNLVVQDGLKELDLSISKMRVIVKYVKSSPQREEIFRNYFKETSGSGFLQQDICTRWNSTYIMLKSVQEHQMAFSRMLLREEGLRKVLNERGKEGKLIGVGMPTNNDWARIKKFVDYLKVFYDATLTFSTSNSCTAHMFFAELFNIKKQLNAFTKSQDPFFKAMATRMHRKYVKYWGELSNEEDPSLRLIRFLLVATILDPRCKLKWFKYWLPKIIGDTESNQVIALAKKTFEDLFSEYNSLYGKGSSIGSEGASSSTAVVEDPYALGWQNELDNEPEEQTELELYLYVKPEAFKSSVLDWWKLNEVRYPILFRMARDILVIPISTVPSESVFSTSGRILNAYRCSLSPGTAEGLILAQNWLRDADKSEKSYKNEINFCYDGIADQDIYEFDKELRSNPDKMLDGIIITNKNIQEQVPGHASRPR